MRIVRSLLIAVAVFVAVPSLAVAAQYQCRYVDKDTLQIVTTRANRCERLVIQSIIAVRYKCLQTKA